LLKFNRNNILLISKISFPILIIFYVVFVRFDSEILSQNIYNIFNRFESIQLLFKSEQLTYGSTADRLSFLKLGLSTFMDNPFFGVGSNNFVVLFPGTGYTHNNYIEILANLGIVGFLPFYLMYFVLIKKLSKISNKGIRYFLLAFVALFLFKEFALVTYYSKYLIIVMFWLYLTAEEKINENYLLSKNK
jgi:O-antigen ligase